MTDIIDMAQARQQDTIDRQLAAHRAKMSGVSASVCEECDQPIPEARRAAFPGVTRCVSCQSIHEEKQRHFK